MTKTLARRAATRVDWIITCTLSLRLLVSSAMGADADKEDKDLAIGTIARVESGRITVQKQEGKEGERTIRLTKDSTMQFVGFKGIGQPAEAPQTGFGVKAMVAAGDVVKSVIFTPAIPPLKHIPNKHKLTAPELFKASDQNKNERVDYVEYSTWIFQSYKHLPDRFISKLDTNHDDTLDLKEFTDSLGELDWWRVSRKSAQELVRDDDKDKSGDLNIEEIKALTRGAHGKLDQLFKKLDRDSSGAISPGELQPYLDSEILGKKRDRQKQ